MKLGNEQIQSILQGAVYFSEEEKGLQPHRMNKEEEALYIPTKFKDKAFASSNIQAVFKTDADKLSLKADIALGSSRKYFCFDIYIDEEFTAEFKNFEHQDITLPYTQIDCPLGEFSWELPLKKGEKEIRIVFPFGSRVIISEFSLENATYIEPVKRSRTMLIYGDSITQGYDALNPSKAYAVELAHELDAEAFSKAIGGEIFNPSLAAIKNDINPDYITVAYGTNDWSFCTKEDFTANCKGFYENIRRNYPDAKLFAITPIWRGDRDEEKKYGLFEDIHKTIRSICEEIGGITIIDGYNFVPSEKELYADLRLHPSNDGFEHYIKNLTKEIRKYI